MLKRVLITVFVVGLLGVSGLAIVPNQIARPKRVERIGQLMEKLGSGEDALIAVRLKDKSVLTGHVHDTSDYSFILVRKDSGEEVKVSYYKIDRLQGYNLQTGSEVHEGTGVRAALARAALKVLPGHQVQSNSLTGGGKTLLIGIILGIILAIILAKVL